MTNIQAARVIEPHSNAVLHVGERHIIQWDTSSNPTITDIVSANLYKGFGSDIKLIQSIPINRKASAGCSEPFVVPNTTRGYDYFFNLIGGNGEVLASYYFNITANKQYTRYYTR
ncbi:9793_t:CDS:2 [Funneliformis geosporum]|uniref:9786_t:CDS:1 n=1 Tax=Funneliformis geosporum TaxID=1117311 RepID=A0A9W4SWW7_9GLOM|nr:9793_t:CDS:2 [Funneliformis geosporum]CAI2183656.1 9786_t:CDS:2 [Funneliformis geosporum]